MLPSGVEDLAEPEIAGYVLGAQGSPGLTPPDRVKLFKLAWDAVGSEFASRHTQYEMFYAGAGFVTKGHSFRTYDWDRATALVDRLMVGYNLAEELERTRGIDGGQTNRSSNTDHCPQRANPRSVFYPARKRG